MDFHVVYLASPFIFSYKEEWMTCFTYISALVFNTSFEYGLTLICNHSIGATFLLEFLVCFRWFPTTQVQINSAHPEITYLLDSVKRQASNQKSCITVVSEWCAIYSGTEQSNRTQWVLRYFFVTSTSTAPPQKGQTPKNVSALRMKFCILELTSSFFCLVKATWICRKLSGIFFVVGRGSNSA